MGIPLYLDLKTNSVNTWRLFICHLIAVFKHEGLRSALDQVKLAASDARKNK